MLLHIYSKLPNGLRIDTPMAAAVVAGVLAFTLVLAMIFTCLITQHRRRRQAHREHDDIVHYRAAPQ